MVLASCWNRCVFLLRVAIGRVSSKRLVFAMYWFFPNCLSSAMFLYSSLVCELVTSNFILDYMEISVTKDPKCDQTRWTFCSLPLFRVKPFPFVSTSSEFSFLLNFVRVIWDMLVVSCIISECAFSFSLFELPLLRFLLLKIGSFLSVEIYLMNVSLRAWPTLS